MWLALRSGGHARRSWNITAMTIAFSVANVCTSPENTLRATWSAQPWTGRTIPASFSCSRRQSRYSSVSSVTSHTRGPGVSVPIAVGTLCRPACFPAQRGEICMLIGLQATDTDALMPCPLYSAAAGRRQCLACECVHPRRSTNVDGRNTTHIS